MAASDGSEQGQGSEQGSGAAGQMDSSVVVFYIPITMHYFQ
jgi:hypothetical protein